MQKVQVFFTGYRDTSRSEHYHCHNAQKFLIQLLDSNTTSNSFPRLL